MLKGCTKLQNKNTNTVTNITNNHDTNTIALFWTFFFESIKPYWKFITGQIIVAIIWSIDFVLRPYLIKRIVDLMPDVLISGSVESLTRPIVLYICLTFFVFLTLRFYEWIVLTFHPNLIKRIGVMLMTNLMNKSHRFFQNQFSGSLANKVNDVASGVSDILDALIDQFLSSIVTLALAIWSVHTVNPKFSIALVLWIVVFLSFSLKFSGKASKLSKNSAQKRSDIVGLIVDVLTNMFSVRVFVTKNHEINTLESIYQRFVHSYQNRDWFFMKMHTAQEISFIIYQILCFLWLIQGMKLKTITPGDFVLIMMLNIAIINTLHSLSHNIRNFAEAFGNTIQGLQTIFIDAENENLLLAKNDRRFNINKGEIRFVSTSFAYPMSDEIFNKLSITIPSGQKIGLVGYSGSGKTTFINLILGFFETSGGQILIDNQDIGQIPKELLRQNVGIIPQDIALFNRSLMENIRYGRTYASDEEVIAASKKAKAHEFISSLPEGYNSLVGERGVKLSGGERQRIAIARAILKNAPILLLDEATNQLDSITENKIQKSLTNLMQGKTAIIIAHRLSTLLHLDRILVFDKGKIVQDGKHNDLIKRPGLYKTLWDTQSHGFLPINRSSVASTVQHLSKLDNLKF